MSPQRIFLYGIIATVGCGALFCFAWILLPSVEPARYSGMGSTFVTALLPKMELGQREALTKASGERDQPVAIAIRGSSRRLVVVVPGLGGNSTDAMNLWFARPFLKRNDHVWILPSPTNESYAKVLLNSMDFDESVRSLCRLLEDRLNRQADVEIRDIILAGYSFSRTTI